MCMFICKYITIHKFVNIYIYKYMHIYMYIHIYIHIYTGKIRRKSAIAVSSHEHHERLLYQSLNSRCK